MIKEVALPSGNKAIMSDPSFEDVLELQEYIARNVNNIPADALSKGIDTDVVSLLKFLPSLIENREFRQIVLKCGTRCKIKKPNGDMADFDLAYFSDAENRVDYYSLMKEVAEFALAPLFKGIKAMNLKDLIKKVSG